jgi:hypothetical protein
MNCWQRHYCKWRTPDWEERIGGNHWEGQTLVVSRQQVNLLSVRHALWHARPGQRSADRHEANSARDLFRSADPSWAAARDRWHTASSIQLRPYVRAVPECKPSYIWLRLFRAALVRGPVVPSPAFSHITLGLPRLGPCLFFYVSHIDHRAYRSEVLTTRRL